MIFGLGIDVIEVDRIRKQILNGQRFKEKIFTLKEMEYCEKKRNKSQNYAARFAAKEAFLKALGTGQRDGLIFRDIEIINSQSGKPGVVLYGKTKQEAEKKGIANIHVSISHIKDIACSIVILEK